MMNFRPLIISGVFTFLASTCAHADLVVNNSVNAFGNTLTNSARSASSLGIEVNNSAGSLIDPFYFSYTSAYAYANYGVLKASSLSTTNIRPSGTGGGAFAQFSDTITINSPGLLGQRGTINADFIFNWKISARKINEGGSDGTGVVVINFNRNQYSEMEQAIVDNSGPPRILSSGGYNGSSNLPFSFDIRIVNDFTFGQPIPIFAYLNVFSDAAVGAGFAEGRIDAANSAYWNGIQSIFSNNQVINNFTVVSTSGANYKNSFVPLAVVPDPNNVPEPASLVLVGIGMLGLAISRKKFSRGK